MKDFPGVRRLFRLGSRSPTDTAREVDDEIATHLALRVEQLKALGLSDDEAWLEAHRRFGDWPASRSELIESARRRQGRLRFLESAEALWQDAAFALRQLRRAPGHAAFAMITLALAIGLTTGIFAAVDGVLLRPLPWPAPERLVRLQSMDSSGGIVPEVSADNWNDWRESNRTFTGIALLQDRRLPAVVGGDAYRLSAEVVSAGFFDVLAPRLVRGRVFRAGDETRAEVVISEGLWQRLLHAAPVPGARLRLGSHDVDVIGVVASGQEYPEGAELWVAEPYTHVGGAARNNVNYLAIGRLRPGVSLAQAEADLGVIARHIREAEPQGLYSFGVHITALREDILGPAREYLPLLMGATILVLLIACANLASANLARGAARAREMAIRAAIGASRARIIRQLLVEHVLLALLGGAAGYVLARLMVRAVALGAASQVPRAGNIQLDVRALLFAFAISTLAGLVAGLLPARQASRDAAQGPLAGGRGSVSGGRGLPGRTLVAVEIALAVVLVAGAGLLLRSVQTLLARPLGFETHGVAVAEITLSGERYAGKDEAMLAYWQSLAEAVRSDPQVRAAGLANWIPLGLAGGSFVDIAGSDIKGAGAGYRLVGPGYFEALGVRLIAGRLFTAQDDSASAPVAIINQSMASQYWKHQNPIGRLVRATSQDAMLKGGAPWRTVVGVVANIRQWGYETDFAPEMYVPYPQSPGRTTTMHLVAAGRDAQTLAAVLRTRIRAQDPGIAADIETFQDRVDRDTAERRFTMSVLTIFGVFALLLAAIGVYGTLALSVAQRTRELAVRAALGADRRALLDLVLASGLRVIAIGVGAGLVATWFATRLMASLVFRVSTHDPLALFGSIVTILVAGLLAAVVPALRATRADPMVALHAD